MLERAAAVRARCARRRTVRHFSADPVPPGAVRDCIAAAASAPSGANKQPWTFVLVTDSALKREIRLAAEAEERAFYGGRALTHTPSPMGFLGDILGRPKNERAYVLLPIGYPTEDCRVPDIGKKPLGEIRVRAGD